MQALWAYCFGDRIFAYLDSVGATPNEHQEHMTIRLHPSSNTVITMQVNIKPSIQYYRTSNKNKVNVMKDEEYRNKHYQYVLKGIYPRGYEHLASPYAETSFSNISHNLMTCKCQLRRYCKLFSVVFLIYPEPVPMLT